MRKTKPHVIDVADDNFGAVINCAVRYALGRRTYMPSLVRRFIYPLLPYLSDRTLYTLEMDLREAPSYGDPVTDTPGWLQLLSDTRRTIKQREDAKNDGLP